MKSTRPEQLAAQREARRLAAVAASDIFNPVLNGVLMSAALASTALIAVPIGIISVVTKDTIQFRSRVGIEMAGTGREPGLDGSAILFEETWIVEDALLDPLACNHSLVARSNGIRFYAGKAIRSADGLPIGALSIMDYAPRKLKKNQIAGLKEIARLIEEVLKLRASPKG